VKAPPTGRKWFDGTPSALPCCRAASAKWRPLGLSGLEGSRFRLHLWAPARMRLGGVTLLYLQCDSRMRRRGVGARADKGESHTRLWTRQRDFAVEEDKKAENFLGIRW
jgi:hypothetical protein